MKRILILLTFVLMAFSFSGCKTKDVMYDNLTGDYIDIAEQKAIATVLNSENEYYDITINWDDDFEGLTIWSIHAKKDGNILKYTNENISYIMFDAIGNVVDRKETTVENLGFFEIKKDTLKWNNPANKKCEECIFKKISYAEK